MYRTMNETKITVKTMSKDRKSHEIEITIPAKISTEADIKAAKKLVQSDDIIMWGTFKISEITETAYFMDDTVFMALATKLDKPNPAMITRTVNDTLVTITVFNDKEVFSEKTLSFTGKLDEPKIQQAIEKSLKDEYLFSIDNIKNVSGLFGMTPANYIKNAVKGESKTVFKG